MISIFHILFIGYFLFQTGQNNTSPFFHGSRQEKKIALTFDACPSSTRGGYNAKIVSILVDSNVSASFFLSGKWVLKHRRDIKYIASISGFEIGNHSYSHPHCSKISDDSIRQELLQTEQLLHIYSGTYLKLYRPPFGEIDGRIAQIANDLGFITVMYDLASGDPDTTISKARLVQYVTSRTRNGSIIVMHVNGRGWHTAEALPEIIHSLRKKGFVFVKVSELIEAQNSVSSHQGGNK